MTEWLELQPLLQLYNLSKSRSGTYAFWTVHQHTAVSRSSPPVHDRLHTSCAYTRLPAVHSIYVFLFHASFAMQSPTGRIILFDYQVTNQDHYWAERERPHVSSKQNSTTASGECDRNLLPDCTGMCHLVRSFEALFGAPSSVQFTENMIIHSIVIHYFWLFREPPKGPVLPFITWLYHSRSVSPGG